MLLLMGCGDVRCDYEVLGLCVMDSMDVGKEATTELVSFFIEYQNNCGWLTPGWAAHAVGTSSLHWVEEVWYNGGRKGGLTYPMWKIQIYVDVGRLGPDLWFWSALFHELIHAMEYRRFQEADQNHVGPHWRHVKLMKELWLDTHPDIPR